MRQGVPPKPQTSHLPWDPHGLTLRGTVMTMGSHLRSCSLKNLCGTGVVRVQLPPQPLHLPPESPGLSPGDLALADIQPALWHEAHAPLRLLAAVGVQVVHVGRLICDLKVPYAAVTLWAWGRVSAGPGLPRDGVTWGDAPQGRYLPTEVDNAGVGVVEGQQDPVARVHLLQGDGLLEVLLRGRSRGWG